MFGGSEKTAGSRPPTPILAYGSAPSKPWRFVIATAIVALLLPGLFAWRNREEIRQWTLDRQQRAEIRGLIESNLRQADSDLSSARWSDAQIAIDRARLAASANPTIFHSKEIMGFYANCDSAQMHLNSSLTQDLKQHPEKYSETRGCKFSLSDLSDRADKSMREGDYDRSQEIAKQILLLDPSNQHASDLLEQANQHLPETRPSR